MASVALSNKLFLINCKQQECVIIGWAVLQENYPDLHVLRPSLEVSAYTAEFGNYREWNRF